MLTKLAPNAKAQTGAPKECKGRTMTIICALKAEGGVWIGSDTMAQNGYLAEDVGPKWFQIGGWWCGAPFTRFIRP
jgi:20S proteasome alpha/beta subunit